MYENGDFLFGVNLLIFIGVLVATVFKKMNRNVSVVDILKLKGNSHAVRA